MKKIIFYIFCFITVLNLNGQVRYKGLAISGHSSNNFSKSSTNSFTSLSLNNTLSFHYFFNKNNIISFTPKISYANAFRSNNPLLFRSVGFSYRYIYWIKERIGVESALNLSGIGGDEINLNLELSGIARLTNALELTFRISNSNLYSKLKIDNSSQNSAPISNSYFSSSSYGIPVSLITSVGFRYRIPSYNSGLDTNSYIPKRLRKFGLKFSFEHSQNESSFISSTGPNSYSESSSNEFGISYINDPFASINYSINFSFNKTITHVNSIFDNNRSESKFMSLNPMIRKSYYYADGFGLFIQGGPLLGYDYGTLKSYTVGLNGEAGFTYIVRDRIIIDGALSSMSFQRTKSKLQSNWRIRFIPLSFARISGTILF